MSPIFPRSIHQQTPEISFCGYGKSCSQVNLLVALGQIPFRFKFGQVVQEIFATDLSVNLLLASLRFHSMQRISCSNSLVTK